jgi:hypothetical protein
MVSTTSEMMDITLMPILVAVYDGHREPLTPLEQRLVTFYRAYYDSSITRHWLKLLLYSSLAGLEAAPTYAGTLVKHVIEIVVDETAHETGRAIPDDIDQLMEIGWMLHGAVSHLALRRRIYGIESSVPAEDAISTYVRAFLAGVPTLLPTRRST